VDKHHILLAEPIKQLGMYTLKIQLHKEVETKIKLWVISDESK
jgi:large subunit ribosomal protein L9